MFVYNWKKNSLMGYNKFFKKYYIVQTTPSNYRSLILYRSSLKFKTLEANEFDFQPSTVSCRS